MSRKRSQRRSGQTLVESAVAICFVLVPLTMGFIQFAIVSNAATTIQEISREAGRFAAVHALESTFDGAVTQGDTTGQTPSLRNYIKKVCQPTSISYTSITTSPGAITVTPALLADRDAGSPVSVGITYPMVQKVFLGNLFPGYNTMAVLKKNYTVTSTFVLE